MGLLNTLQDIVRDVYESTGDLPVFRGLVLQCLEAMSNTDEKTCRFAIDDFLDDFSDNKEIGQMAKRKLVQRYARVFSRLQNVRSTKRFPELHASMASAAGELFICLSIQCFFDIVTLLGKCHNNRSSHYLLSQ